MQVGELEVGVADNLAQLPGLAIEEASVGPSGEGVPVAEVPVLQEPQMWETELSVPVVLEGAGLQGSEEDQQLEHQAMAKNCFHPG